MNIVTIRTIFDFFIDHNLNVNKKQCCLFNGRK